MISSVLCDALSLVMAEALFVNGYGNFHSRGVSSATTKEVSHG